MIEIVVIDTDKPDKITEAIMGDHAFVMNAKKLEEGSYAVHTVALGNDVSLYHFISNLASAVHTQLISLSEAAEKPYEITIMEFIKKLAIAKSKVPEKQDA